VTDLKEASGAPLVDPIYVEARRVLLDALTQAQVETLAVSYTERLLNEARS
jgi:hypothetical protein